MSIWFTKKDAKAARLGFGLDTKINHSLSESPQIEPSIIGKTKQNSIYFGEEATSKRGIMYMSAFMSNRTIVMWDNAEQYFDYCFEKCGNLKNYNLLCTNSAAEPEQQANKLQQIMFEKYQIPQLCLMHQAQCALYAYGQTEGVVVDAGEQETHLVTISNSQIVCKSIARVGGAHVTNSLIQLLAQEQQLVLKSFGEIGLAREMKRLFSHVNIPSVKVEDLEYELPDGTMINIPGKQRTDCAEVLFQPEFGFLSTLDKHLSESNQQVFLTGGTANMKGFSERIVNDLPAKQLLIQQHSKHKDNSLLPWYGGCILSTMSTFGSFCTTKEQYHEYTA